MDETQKNLELLKIFSESYRDKHHHYWNIYFKFFLAISLVCSVYVFNEKNVCVYLYRNRLLTFGVFALIVLLLGVMSTVIMLAENKVLHNLQKDYNDLCDKFKMGGEGENLNGKGDRSGKKIPIGQTMAVSLMVLAVGCVACMVICTFVID